MKSNNTTTIPEAAPWTGGFASEPERALSRVAEKVKAVLTGRNLPGPVDQNQKGKRVRIPRSNRK